MQINNTELLEESIEIGVKLLLCDKIENEPELLKIV